MNTFFSLLSLEGNILVFLSTALAIAHLGVKMTYLAREIAERSGFGEALTGAILIGASTSLSGIATSVTAASQGAPELAVSNCDC